MVRTHLLDLVIILLPFLRPLRAARSFRLLRTVAAAGRSAIALRRLMTRPGFRGFLLVVGGVISISAALAYAFERGQADSTFDHFGDALWWAVVTSSTVGYGDHFPVTPEGRGVAVLLMLVGIGLLSVLTANIAAFFIEEEKTEELDSLRDQLARIRGQAAGGPPRQHGRRARKTSVLAMTVRQAGGCDGMGTAEGAGAAARRMAGSSSEPAAGAPARRAARGRVGPVRVSGDQL